MIKFKLRFCRVLMARYVSGDLSDGARRRVGRYIGECPDCYRVYRRHRDFAQTLERSLPSLGAPSDAAINRVWAKVQADMQMPSRGPMPPREPEARASLGFGAAVAIAALALALLAPSMLGSQASAQSIDLPQAPLHSRIQATDLAEEPISMATARARSSRVTPALQNTPAPGM